MQGLERTDKTGSEGSAWSWLGHQLVGPPGTSWAQAASTWGGGRRFLRHRQWLQLARRCISECKA